MNIVVEPLIPEEGKLLWGFLTFPDGEDDKWIVPKPGMMSK